jgi:hypothetical protein
MKTICQICNKEVAHFNAHLEKEHKLTREQYAFMFHTDEIVVCKYCNKEFYRKLSSRKTRKICYNKECVKKSFQDRGKKIGKTNRENGHYNRLKGNKDFAKSISEGTKKWHEDNPSVRFEIAEKKRQDGFYDSVKSKERAKKSIETKKDNGYFESEQFKNIVKTWSDAGVLFRKTPSQKRDEAIRKAEEKKWENGFYDSDRAKERIAKGMPQRIETNNDRYGGNAPACSEDVVKKMEDTYFEKTGYKNAMQNPEVKKQIQQDCLLEYGVECHGQREDVKEKIKETFIKNYGVDNILKTEKVRDKCNSPEAQAKRKLHMLERGSYKKAAIIRHQTMKRNGTYGKSASEDFLYQLMCRKFPLDWTILRQQNVPFGEDQNLCVDFLVKTDKNEEVIILVDSYWHGLGRDEEEIKQFKTPRDRTIYKTLLKDRSFNEWVLNNGQHVLRFSDIDIKCCTKNKQLLNSFFSCCDDKLNSEIINKLNNIDYDLF